LWSFASGVTTQPEWYQWESGFIVRKGITKYLDFLCVGSRRAPVKIAQANAQKIKILNHEDFERMIDTINAPILSLVLACH